MPTQTHRKTHPSPPIRVPLQALPGYLGGKRRLLRWIGSTLTRAIPVEQWPRLTLIDLFMGGGSVSLWAKAQGFQRVIANDSSLRSQILADAFLKNTRVTLSREETLQLIQPLADSARPGFIETHYCPSVFSTRHAQALDGGFHGARQHPDPVKQALLLTILWHLCHDFVAFATSLGRSNRPFAEALDGLRAWDSLNPKRFTDGSLKRLCAPTWHNLENLRKRVNAGVLGGAPVRHMREEAIALLPQLTGDILYLDPPYAGTTAYESGNAVLDSILAGEISAKPLPSEFSTGTAALQSLLKHAGHIPVWLLSYGNQTLELAELLDLVKAHAGHRVVEGFFRPYRHLTHVSKNDHNQELLILAYPKP